MNRAKRLAALEDQGEKAFCGYAVIASWRWPGLSKEEAVAAYIEANGPVPDNKPVLRNPVGKPIEISIITLTEMLNEAYRLGGSA